jgi:two-component system, chemotaxis family, CheB/CheR fusion protein
MARRKQADPEEIQHLVVIGSSAGGIDALGELVATLPANFGAPIIIAQHLDPRRESHLAEILQRRSPLPIKTVMNHQELSAGVIFVVPADRHVVIDDHAVRVEADGLGRERSRATPRPSIDRALASAADAYGEGLIAVILTGAGSDGAAGARHVKAAGGTVVIQNPETASYPAMPLSLAPTTVDVVADLEAIGPLLADLVTGVYVPRRPDEESTLISFLDEVRESTGIDFSQYKRPTILRRLQRRMLATGREQLREYIRFAHGHQDEMQRLANSFLIKVTEFFRDPDLYDYLGDHVLPDLMEYAAGNGGEVRFWSAGCATGEEAYSLAIIAAEAKARLGDDIRMRIFATDVDNDAIEFARRGIYPAAAVDHVPDELKSRYFIQSAGQFEVAPAIRSLLAFGQHDLAQRAPFPRIDMTICRNVLIYFTNELQRRALQLFAFALRDGGYLVLGKAETSSPLADHFVLEQPRLKVFRRRGSRVVLPAARAAPQLAASIPRAAISAPGRARLAREVAALRASDADRARTQSGRADQIVMRLPVGLVLVDRKYDIALINTAARNLLGVHGAAIGQDLVHQVHGVPNNELRRDIDRAFRGEPARSVWDIQVADSTSGETMALEVRSYRQGEGGLPDDDMVAIIVRDVTTEHGENLKLQETYTKEAARAERLESQIRRMTEAAQRLREANAELTSVNGELRSQNDDLVVSNEEVQAATEEVETLNEEMQATNEELETLNEELQATVEELNTTNDDLEARSNELQTLAISLERQREVSEGERARLAAVLLSMADAVVVVNDKGEPILTNEAFDSTFANSDGLRLLDDSGEPIAPDQIPWKRGAIGEAFSDTFSMIDATGNRHWYEANGRPLGGDTVQGAVVVIRDLTDRSLQRLQNEFVSMVSHELRTPLTGVSAYLELLERELRESPATDAHRYAQRALNQAQRFSLLVSELFDANRLRSGTMAYRFAPVDLRPIVDEAIAISKPLATKQRIIFHPPRTPLQVSGDPERLQQVVLNLIGNAITHATSSPTIDVSLRRAGANAELAVTDHGPGMPASRVEAVLSRQPERAQAFGSKDGLGLGLYIVRSIVEAHQGEFAIDSKEGKGSTLTVHLPLVNATAKSPAKRKARPRSRA